MIKVDFVMLKLLIYWFIELDLNPFQIQIDHPINLAGIYHNTYSHIHMQSEKC